MKELAITNSISFIIFRRTLKIVWSNEHQRVAPLLSDRSFNFDEVLDKS